MFRFLVIFTIISLAAALKSVRLLSAGRISRFALNSDLKDKQTSVTPFETFARTFKGSIDKQTLKERLYLLSAKTARGARATELEKDEANRSVHDLSLMSYYFVSDVVQAEMFFHMARRKVMGLRKMRLIGTTIRREIQYFSFLHFHTMLALVAVFVWVVEHLASCHLFWRTMKRIGQSTAHFTALHNCHFFTSMRR